MPGLSGQKGGIAEALEKINRDVVACKRCPRLVEYREHIAKIKVRRFKDHVYWGKAVPGFGDPAAQMLVIGLAPGAHGANRTGRMFTGDDSGRWLFRALYESGFANQPESESRHDGLKLSGAYITAVLRCVPPQNKPLREEILNCESFLKTEIALFKPQLRVIVCLGNIAFTQFCRISNIKGWKFAHGANYQTPGGITVIASYHPSRQNTNTGKLKWEQWLAIFQAARKILAG